MTDMMLCDVIIPWLDKLIMFYVSLVNWTLLLSYDYWWAIVTAYMDLCCGMFIMDMLNVCWWVGIRHVWCLLSNAHSVFLSLLCCRLPLYDEFMKRLLTFAQRCINCDNNLVNFVVRYAIWYGRMASPLGCSIFQCCSKYDFEYDDFMSLSHQYIQRYYRKAVSDEDVARTRLLLELLFYYREHFLLPYIKAVSK